MKNEKSANPGLGVGMASVLLIVLVLALTCFGLLALVSARADYAHSQRANTFATAYYAAEGRLQQQLAELDAALADGGRTLDRPLLLVEEVGPGQELQLEVAPSSGPDRYVVRGCVLVNTGDWTPDEELDVWGGPGEE